MNLIRVVLPVAALVALAFPTPTVPAQFAPVLEVDGRLEPLLPPGPVSISQSSSADITAGNSVTCTGITGNLPTSMFRAFTLAAFDPPLDSLLFHVDSVTVGIESAASGNGQGQTLTLRLYDSSTNPPTLASLGAPLSTTYFLVADQTHTLLPLRVAAPPTLLNANDVLVVELAVPSGTVTLDSLALGSNDLPELAPGYIYAPECGVDEISTLAQFGSPGMHIVMTVFGDNDAAAAARIFSDGFECGTTLNRAPAFPTLTPRDWRPSS